MTIKTLLLFVFLYVCLVWVGAAYFYPDNLREFGLRWTFIGIAAVLAWLLLARIWAWVRVARAKSAARPMPAKPVAPSVVLNEDESGLLALLNEAENSLARSELLPLAQRSLSALPIYLLVGPENSGKTSTFMNSGLDPTPLASQGTSAGQSTRLANIWLAKNAIFIELGGRAFAGDLARWASLLRVLKGQSSTSGWRRLFEEGKPPFAIRGVIAFCEAKEFHAVVSQQGKDILDKSARHWRERLTAVVDALGRALPVYVVATKADVAIPYFADYFARMRDPDINQIFGCTLPLVAKDAPALDTSADAESKRLTAALSPLLHRLADMRLARLAYEPDAQRKPGIYEFPREVRRIRPALVQFLVEVFRTNPLRPTPILRGFYFTGTRDDDSAVSPISTQSADQTTSDATAFFQGDATQIFKAADLAKGAGAAPPAPRGSLRRRWVFVSDLFSTVILRDQAIPSVVVQTDPRVDFERRVVMAVACGVCALLATAFVWSWVRNNSLLNSLSSISADASIHTKPATLADLDSLDNLRDKLGQLLDYDRNGPPLGLRWGLYSGDKLAPAVRDLYFRRFRELLLDDLNGSLTSQLKALPESPAAGDPSQPATDTLRAHLMITSGACPVDSSFISRTLRDDLSQMAPNTTSAWRIVADRQIEFYANELNSGNPFKLAEDTTAVDRGRQYLRGIQGIDPIYNGLLAQVAKSLADQPQRLSDVAPNYAQVLHGKNEVNAVFTREGMLAFLNFAKSVKGVNAGEPCVMGSSNSIKELGQTLETQRILKDRYDRDYIKNWQDFVKSFSNIGYSGRADAARKLSILADHRSPLLGLLAMTAKQTYFPEAATPAIVQKTKSAVDGVKKIFDSVKGAAPAPEPPADAKSIDPIARAFQPVHAVVAPTSDTWITEKNKPYVDALSDLAGSMDQMSKTKTENLDPAVFQAAKQNYEKALAAARQLASGFDPTGTNGLDAKVQTLLVEPIEGVGTYIPSDPTLLPFAKLNGEAHSFCSIAEPILRKYPFRPSMVEASLDEVTRLFAPGSGEVWKFQAKSLADSTLKDAGVWKAKDGAKVPVQPNVIVFLNKAQAITDAFFSAGANQPHLVYTLRPKLDDKLKGFVVTLTVDGQAQEWKTSIQKQFTWPATGGAEPGARAAISKDISVPFASRGGVWGIFRLMSDAEPRQVGAKVVEWKYLRGGGGRPEPIQPAPVRLEFVDFPGGADVFNPGFFDQLHCPSIAAAQ